MKNLSLLSLTAIAACMVANHAMAVDSTGHGYAKAKLVSAVEVQSDSSTDALNFGTMSIGASGVVVNHAGQRSGGDGYLINDGNTPQAARIKLAHQPDVAGQVVTVNQIPNTTITDGSATIPVTTLTPSSTTTTLTTATHDDFTVGGTLGDTTNKPGGEYSGSFDVTVSY